MQITDEERTAGRLTTEAIEAIRRAFEADGCFFLEAVVDEGPLAACRAAVQANVAGEHHIETFDGRDRIGATFFEFDGPFADPAIVANPILLQVLHALLGDAVSCAIYNTNVSLVGAELDQPVHVDLPSRVADGSFWFRTCRCT